jgi:hypothetical protein
MNGVPSRWRRLAVTLAQHAAWMLPGARSPWAQAMRRELDYIADDGAALRWALGCILASYRARLAHRLSLSRRTVGRTLATAGALMLVIGVMLQENAGGQTQPPRPAFDATACDLLDRPVERRPSVRCDLIDVPRGDNDVRRCACPEISDTPRGR